MGTRCLTALLFAALCCFVPVVLSYDVGVGIADITGPPNEVNFMGYANLQQNGRGIHLRQYARSYVIGDGDTKVAFVSADVAMVGIGLRKEVIRLLQKDYGNMYNTSNVIISGTHTHATPGGYMMHLLFDISILGFVRQTFNVYASGIAKSISLAHESLTPAKIFYNEGKVTNANINRSPSSYLANPKEERDRYPDGDTDKIMAQLKFFSTKDNTIIGAINWFAVHPVSMQNTNLLVSSDNVGYASILLEEHMDPGAFPGKGKFVGAFAASNLGDVSPNIKGPVCEFTGKPCDVLSSRCENQDEKCFASGPGKDMFESTKIIAERLYAEGLRLLDQNDHEVTGPIRAVHQYLDVPKEKVPDYNPVTQEFIKDTVVGGCSPAMGYSFAAGTTDGPGAFNFSQGTTSGNPMWDSIRDLLAKPTDEDIECHAPKPILLAGGRMNFPYEWQPKIVSTQLAMIGDLVIAAVPGEFTTMSGRRMRALLKNTFAKSGKDVKVVIGGLSNTYTSYIATPEEYQVQRYEAASTIYGPNTLTIYLHKFSQLAKAIIEGDTVDEGPSPPDFSNDLISLVTPVIFDMAPFGLSFGDVTIQPESNYNIGSTVRVRFVSGNPRNNLMTGESYLYVEKYDEQTSKWIVVAVDSHWETRFVWERESLILGTSKVDIYWDVPEKTVPGTYRIRHTGNFKYILGSTKAYEGISRTFQVVAKRTPFVRAF